MSEPVLESKPSFRPTIDFNTTMSTSKQYAQSAVSDRLSSSSEFSDKSFLRQHHYSMSGSSTFCSNETSPTTTCSTVDDSSATEPSPDSSPESPPPASFPMGLRPQSADDEKQSAFFDLQRVASPPRKGRNLKNLAVITSRSTGQAPSLTSIPPGPQRQDSAPSILSPAFMKPPESQKRRPTNLALTLLTPSNVRNSPKQIRLAIPPTPGFGKPPALRHFQSSPSLPLFTSFNGSPETMVNGLPLRTLDTIFSPLEATSSLSQALQEDDENFDIPLSQEVKPEAYPDGPICVYAPYIDLYLEPTAEQANQYDVVLNVASEVRNPFDNAMEADTAEPQLRIDGGGGIQFAPNRRPSTLQHSNDINGSPTTPKATPLREAFSPSVAPRPGLEYIHIPWEHNSDIVPDLLRLCKLINERVQQQKRVLVHCQCGVSRSASLVVAYGLYKDPSMSVQEAYDAVKQKSKWIGPNMNLIMQLQEYRSSLARGGILSSNRGLSPITPTSALSDWNGPFSAAANDVGPHADTLSARIPATSRSEQFEGNVKSPLAPLSDAWTVSLPNGRARAISAVRATSTYVDPAGHLLPVLSIIEAPSVTSQASDVQNFIRLTPELAPAEVQSVAELPSPRATEFAMTSLVPSQAVNSADFFGIMSPTTSELVANPFDRSALLAQLGMTTHSQSAVPTRTRSLKSTKPKNDDTSEPEAGQAAGRRLRGKISSPTLHQQHQLQSFQAQLEAQLPHRQVSEEDKTTPDATLMSPRATEFTRNPFALAFGPPLTSTADSNAITVPIADPRSPAQKGASPIVRNIEDFL